MHFSRTVGSAQLTAFYGTHYKYIQQIYKHMILFLNYPNLSQQFSKVDHLTSYFILKTRCFLFLREQESIEIVFGSDRVLPLLLSVSFLS